MIIMLITRLFWGSSEERQTEKEKAERGEWKSDKGVKGVT